MKKSIIIILVMVMLAKNISAVTVSGCINITSSGTYDLATNIGPPEGKMDCVYFNASNIIFDGHGYWINASSSLSSGQPINFSGRANNSQLRSAIIRNMTTSSPTSFVFFDETTVNITLFNNSFVHMEATGDMITTTTHSDRYVNNLSIISNYFVAKSEGGTGITLDSASTRNVRNVNISYNVFNMTLTGSGFANCLLVSGPIDNITFEHNNCTMRSTGTPNNNNIGLLEVNDNAIGIKIRNNIFKTTEITNTATFATVNNPQGTIHFNAGGPTGTNNIDFDRNNVTILMSGPRVVGMSLTQGARDNNFTNNIWAINNSNSIIYIANGVRNTNFINNTYMINMRGIVINGSRTGSNVNVTNITFINDSIIPCQFKVDQCNSTNISYEFYVEHNASNIFLKNVNFNKTKLIVNSTGANSDFADKNNVTVQWFFYLNVTDADGNAVSGATVQVNDSKNNVIWQGLTNSRGSIDDLLNVTEFELFGTTAQFFDSCTEAVNEAADAVDNITCYSPLNISVVKSGYNSNSLTYFINATANKTMVLAVAPNTCSCPASGDWVINCADNCIITTDCNMQNNNIHSYGSGSFTVRNFVIRNYRYAFFRCNVFCYSTAPTGCFG